MNPKKFVEYYSRVYPDAWKIIDDFRSQRGRELDWWPDWCFCPLAGAFAIVSKHGEEMGFDIINPSSPKELELIKDVGILGALAAWRVTQGVYRFDKDVFSEVVNTPVNGDIPHEILFQMPEWCVYIETPGLEVYTIKIAGFFAYLEYDVKTYRKELRIVLDFENNGDYDYKTKQRAPNLYPEIVHLGEWPLKEGLRKVLTVV